MDPEIARNLLRDLAARTLVAAYVEEDGGRSLIKVDPATGVAATERGAHRGGARGAAVARRRLGR